MKIRIAHNSIRYRLKQPEVQMLSQRGNINEILEFGITGNDLLRFILEVAMDDQFSLTFQNNTIHLKIPHQLATEWAQTEQVGFEEEIATGNAKTIKVLVEKDFACLDKGEKENEGTYPNPKANC